MFVRFPSILCVCVLSVYLLYFVVFAFLSLLCCCLFVFVTWLFVRSCKRGVGLLLFGLLVVVACVGIIYVVIVFVVFVLCCVFVVASFVLVVVCLLCVVFVVVWISVLLCLVLLLMVCTPSFVVCCFFQCLCLCCCCLVVLFFVCFVVVCFSPLFFSGGLVQVMFFCFLFQIRSLRCFCLSYCVVVWCCLLLFVGFPYLLWWVCFQVCFCFWEGGCLCVFPRVVCFVVYVCVFCVVVCFIILCCCVCLA